MPIDKINYKAKKRRRYSKEVFYQALRDSFNKIVVDGAGAEISKTAIIANALFPDGSSVGETTLYGKRPKTNEYIHKDFLLELDVLIDSTKGSLKKETTGNKTRKETAKEAVARLRADKKQLVMENSSILAQFLMLKMV